MNDEDIRKLRYKYDKIDRKIKQKQIDPRSVPGLAIVYVHLYHKIVAHNMEMMVKGGASILDIIPFVRDTLSKK